MVYGDKNNWWAAYALWVCTLFGHADLRLLDGGRTKWIAEGRPVTTGVPGRPRTDYPVIERDDMLIRAFRDQVVAHLGKPMIDVRSPGEYTGEPLHMPDYPQEGALRGGHHPRRQERALVTRRRCRRHLPHPPGAQGDLRRRGRTAPGRRRRCLLPDRRAVQPHVVRAAPPAGLSAGAQLRRVMDRVEKHRPGPITRGENP